MYLCWLVKMRLVSFSAQQLSCKLKYVSLIGLWRQLGTCVCNACSCVPSNKVHGLHQLRPLAVNLCFNLIAGKKIVCAWEVQSFDNLPYLQHTHTTSFTDTSTAIDIPKNRTTHSFTRILLNDSSFANSNVHFQKHEI